MESVDTVVCDDQLSLLENTESRSVRGSRSTPWFCALSLLAVGFGGAATLRTGVPSSITSDTPWVGLWWVGKAERDWAAVDAVHAYKNAYKNEYEGYGRSSGYGRSNPFWKRGEDITKGYVKDSVADEESDCSNFKVDQEFAKSQCLQKRCESVTDQDKLSNCLVYQCAATDSECRTRVCDLPRLTTKTKCLAGDRECDAYDPGEEKWKCLQFNCAQEHPTLRSNCLVDQCKGQAEGCLKGICSVLADPATCSQGQRVCTQYVAGQDADRRQCVEDSCTAAESDDTQGLVNCFIDQCDGDLNCLKGESPVCESTHLTGADPQLKEDCEKADRYCAAYATSAERHACMVKKCDQTDENHKSNCLVTSCQEDVGGNCLEEVCSGLTDSSACTTGTFKCTGYSASQSLEQKQCIQNACRGESDDTDGLVNCLLAQCLSNDYATCYAEACVFDPIARLPPPTGGADPKKNKQKLCLAGQFQCSAFTNTDEKYQCFEKNCAATDKHRGPVFYANCLADYCAFEVDKTARAACRVSLCPKVDAANQPSCLVGKMDLSVYDEGLELYGAVMLDCSVLLDQDSLPEDLRSKAMSNCIVDTCQAKAPNTEDACRDVACSYSQITNDGYDTRCKEKDTFCEARGDAAFDMDAKFSCLTQKCGGASYNTDEKVNDCVVKWCNDYSDASCRKEVCVKVQEKTGSPLTDATRDAKCLTGQMA